MGGREIQGERVREIEFPTWGPYLPADMTKPDIRGRLITGKGRLFLPADLGEGERRPAVVLIPGLGGPKKRREIAYGHLLAEKGYVVLMTNSYRTRGVGHAIQICRALHVTTAMILADAYAALKHLSTHPLVIPGRIAVVGFSFGGMVSTLAVYKQIHDYYLPGGPAFAAHVSYYGSSIPRLEDFTTTGAPVLIMLGGKDKNVSIPRTEKIAEDLRRGGSMVDLRVFDAFHQWDGPHERPQRMIFHLRHCYILIGEDGTVRDEHTGRKIDGYWSRLRFLLRYSDPRGYLMKRDPAILEESNRLLLAFLEGTGGRAQVEYAASPRLEGSATE